MSGFFHPPPLLLFAFLAQHWPDNGEQARRSAWLPPRVQAAEKEASAEEGESCTANANEPKDFTRPWAMIFIYDPKKVKKKGDTQKPSNTFPKGNRSH